MAIVNEDSRSVAFGERFDALPEEIADSRVQIARVGGWSALTTSLELCDRHGGASVMAQPDDFKLIKQIVAAGGFKDLVGEVDRDKYQRLVELGWLKGFQTNIGSVSYRVTERGRAAASRF